MGWFWGASDSGSDSSSSEDPLRNLDPTLRDFLAKESPVKYSSSNPPAPSHPASMPEPQPEQDSAPTHHSSGSGAETKSQVPSASLYKDGRYAHLWSTYQPLAEIEAAHKSDAEKINDVLDGYKHRKSEIGRAALENCALEQWDVNECFRSGGVASRLTMCRAENRKFDRCYTVQSRFLKALGYLSTYDRPPEVDEKIQMHADTLYHRMLDQEAAIEAAKAEGRPVPAFSPLLTAPIVSTSSKKEIDPSKLSPSLQSQMKERLKGLAEGERELEEKAIKAEIDAGKQVVSHLENIYQKQDEERRMRKEQGRETIGDKFTSIFRIR